MWIVLHNVGGSHLTSWRCNKNKRLDSSPRKVSSRRGLRTWTGTSTSPSANTNRKIGSSWTNSLEPHHCLSHLSGSKAHLADMGTRQPIPSNNLHLCTHILLALFLQKTLINTQVIPRHREGSWGSRRIIFAANHFSFSRIETSRGDTEGDYSLAHEKVTLHGSY